MLALWLAACAGGPSHPLAQHDAFRQGRLANRQARAALARGELDSARQLTEQARQHYQRLDARERVIDCELQLATLALRQNDLTGVRAALARLADWQLTPSNNARWPSGTSSLALREQQTARAADWLKQARAACAAPCARAATLDVFAARIAAASKTWPPPGNWPSRRWPARARRQRTRRRPSPIGRMDASQRPRAALSHYLAALEFDQREGYSAGLAQDLAAPPPPARRWAMRAPPANTASAPKR